MDTNVQSTRADDEDVRMEIDRVLHSLQTMGIDIPVAAEVRNYLLENNDLVKLVPPICRKDKKQFDTRTQLSLEIFKDPEVDDRYLTLYIRQMKYDKDIIRIIQSLEEEFLEELNRNSGYFLVNTDYRPPRNI